MKLARSSYYYEADEGMALEEAQLVEQIKQIRVAFWCYGYRRVTAELRHVW